MVVSQVWLWIRTLSQNLAGGVEVTSVKWEGIVQVDMDVSGGKWIENSPNYRQTWKKLMVNPYARVRNDGDPELSSWQNPEIVSFVDEWTYPGLKDAEGHRHPKIPESFTGIWTGPFSHRNECDGNCCDASGYCSCPGCLRRSRSVKFSQIFKLNARGKEPGESCSADGDCLMNACAWSGNKGVRKKRCCVDKDAYKWYGASGSYCLDQPKDWDCDDDVVCAKGLYCAKSGTEGHSFCREAALKPGDLCDNQHSACTTKACARVGYPDWQWQCCITEDSYKTYFSRQWCINQPEGYPCDVDSVCGTGLTCQKIPATKGGSKGMTYSCQRPSMKAPRAATRSMKKRSQKKWPKKR
ncbi:unnamed protein product [Durusdinium trenchii]|uniref:Uncharacterized protein n=1 Tax=Durusdinium trenchii TaxID=1381693 RepID=A0ABP0M8X3_9DINO